MNGLYLIEERGGCLVRYGVWREGDGRLFGVHERTSLQCLMHLMEDEEEARFVWFEISLMVSGRSVLT